MIECRTKSMPMPMFKAGGYVKVEFKDDRNRLVFGWLDSEPVVFPERLKLGQHLAVSYDNIRDSRRFSD